MTVKVHSCLTRLKFNGLVSAYLISKPIISTRPGYKYSRNFSVQAFILISESCSAKMKGKSRERHKLS